MSKSISGNLKINRRRALLLPAGIGAAMALPAEAADTGARPASGDCSTPRSAVAKTQYGKVRGYVESGVLTFQGDSVRSEYRRREPLASGQTSQTLGWRVSCTGVRRELPAAAARLHGGRTVVPLPVDRRLHERRYAQAERLDSLSNRQASRAGLLSRRRLHVRVGVRIGVAGRRPIGPASRRGFSHGESSPQSAGIPRPVRDRRRRIRGLGERRNDRPRRLAPLDS